MTTKKENAGKAKKSQDNTANVDVQTVGVAHIEPKIVETAGSLPTEEAEKIWSESAPEADKQKEANKTAPESNSGTIQTKNVKDLREVTGRIKTLTGTIYVGVKK